MTDITADHIRRLETKDFIKRNLWTGTCIRCGENYAKCGCTSLQVSALASRIRLLKPEERDAIKIGTPLPAKTTTEKADELVAKANELLKAAEELKAQAAREAARYQYPAEPPFQRGSISVKFRGSSQWYEYLVIRAPGGKGYYTTGQGDTAHYASWRKFVDWLRSDDIVESTKYTSLVLGTSEIPVP